MAMLVDRCRDYRVKAKSCCKNSKNTNNWFDSRTGNGSLCPWKRHLILFPIGTKQSTVVVAQPDKRLANRTQKSALRWCEKCMVHTNEQRWPRDRKAIFPSSSQAATCSLMED